MSRQPGSDEARAKLFNVLGGIATAILVFLTVVVLVEYAPDLWRMIGE